MLDGIVGGALFLKLFSKTRRKLILFKARKRVQVLGRIHSKHLLFLKVSIGDLNLKLFSKVVSRIDSESAIFRTRDILITLPIYPVKLTY